MSIKRKILISTLVLIFILPCITVLKAQPCTTLGQTAQTAFPICGTTSFFQSSVNICGNTNVVSRCTSSTVNFTDKNPYWYRFTCWVSGTLGFQITPNDLNDDYDWQLFDITGRNVADVYNDISMFVACNWSGEPGVTGAGPSGNSLVLCEGPGVPLFSSMPNIIQGHEYLLLISHFTDSQSGYSLSFGGGTGSITDPKLPHIDYARAICDGTTIAVKLNKKMKCNSIQANGDEFKLNTNLTRVVSTVGVGCSNSFDTDSLVLTLSNPIPPGTYTLTIQNGNTDGNTLLDNCDRDIPPGESVPLIVYRIFPTPMDSITPPQCEPKTLALVFKKPIKCNSIAADGSDFVITGPYAVNIIGARGNCANGQSTIVYVDLSAPLQQAGNFRITLRRGNDGNTLIDECNQECVPGQFLNFKVADTVNADFNYDIDFGCKSDIINFNHNGNNGVNSWIWNFQNQPRITTQTGSVSYNIFGVKDVQLIVNNGVCYDTIAKKINLNNYIKAGFTGDEFICPGDVVLFKDTSIGILSQWNWDFGNGTTSISQNPIGQTYNVTLNSNYTVPVRLIVSNNIPCSDTAIKIVTVVWNCYIDVPSAFTPNNDGLNDYLYPLNAYKTTNLKFSVYNRFGERVFYSENRLQKWDGKFKGKALDIGTYVWILSYYDLEKNKSVERRGTSVLIR